MIASRAARKWKVKGSDFHEGVGGLSARLLATGGESGRKERQEGSVVRRDACCGYGWVARLSEGGRVLQKAGRVELREGGGRRRRSVGRQSSWSTSLSFS